MRAARIAPSTYLNFKNSSEWSKSVISMSKAFNHQEINISFNQEPLHIAQQNRRDRLRVAQGFDPPPASLVAIEQQQEPGGGVMPVYETGGGMWSDMFNYQSLDNQIRSAAPPVGVVGSESWYGMGPLGDSKPNDNSVNRDSHSIGAAAAASQTHQISSLNADSAAAMQLFLMNPQPRSPSSPAPTPPSSLLTNQSSPHHPFHPQSQFQWMPSGTGVPKIGAALENQGLSLTLSTSLQHLEAAKAEEFRMGDDGVFYYDQRGNGASSSAPGFHLKNFASHQNPPMYFQGVAQPQAHNQNHHHLGVRPSIGVVSLLRNSKYVKATQELLEEFCSVGRGQLKSSRSLGRQNSNINPSNAQGSSSSSKDLPPLSAADRIDYQRKKTKLISMLDEVDRRYSHYCEQMQVVVNSFDTVMGFGSALPYTSLAQKAMSRHFRCLKDAITTQLKQTCELLGEKDSAAGSGVTKGETPRLKLLEQSLRQQRAFHQMGMMDQEAWRPQRGLPERSVNILRAWLFEHFLHPYPSDADKLLLARQTGLSRNQVSNWFINARVRLWKPMVEEMYQQEAKDEEGDEDDRESNQTNSITAQTPMPFSKTTATTQPVSTASTATASPTTTTAGKRTQIDDMDNDPSLNAINTQYFSENQAIQATTATSLADVSSFATLHSDVSGQFGVDDSCEVGGIIEADYRTTSTSADMASTLVRFGTTMGDVSLTLGLRHAGNLPEKNQFSVRDFGGC